MDLSPKSFRCRLLELLKGEKGNVQIAAFVMHVKEQTCRGVSSILMRKIRHINFVKSCSVVTRAYKTVASVVK
jgi:hypothetical protein